MADTHCWHSLGTGFMQADGRAGSTQHQCCFCGAIESRVWKLQLRRVEGHGPHHQERVRVYESTNGNPCPGSPNSETEPEEER